MRLVARAAQLRFWIHMLQCWARWHMCYCVCMRSTSSFHAGYGFGSEAGIVLTVQGIAPSLTFLWDSLDFLTDPFSGVVLCDDM